MENLELPGRACSALSQLSVLLKTNVTLIYHSPNWSWKEFENCCLLELHYPFISGAFQEFQHPALKLCGFDPLIEQQETSDLQQIRCYCT